MTVIRNLTRNVISSVIRSVIQGDAAVTRFFTDLVASGSMHYTIPTVTLTGDFEWAVQSTVPAEGGFFAANDTPVTGDDRISFTSDGRIFITLGTTQTTSNSGILSPFQDGKLHNIKFTKVGTTITFFVDGASVYTDTNSGVPTFSSISGIRGTASTIPFFNGIQANVSIIDAGTPIRFYALDEDFATTTVAVDSISGQNGTAINISASELYTQDGADWLGVELVVNSTFPVDLTGWTAANGSSIAHTSGGMAVERIFAGSTFPIGRQFLTNLGVGNNYLVQSTLNNPTASEVFQSIAGISESTIRTFEVSTMISSTFIATGTTGDLDVGFWAASGDINDTVTFRSVSVKRLLEAA